jgi:DNA-binding transcriptional LysR family regulator
VRLHGHWWTVGTTIRERDLKASKLGIHRIGDLEVLVRIVERGSLTAAGVSLGMSTPLVSQRLAALERSLGVHLIDRSSRLLVLTEHGRAFYAYAESILQLFKEAEEVLRPQSADISGTLRISLPTSAIEAAIVTELVALFHKHTKLSIEMHLSDRPVDVIGRGFDVAIYLTDAPDRHPGDLILGCHPTSLAATPGYLDHAGRPMSPDELSSHRTVRAVSTRGTPAEWVLTHNDGREVVLPPSGAMFLSGEARVIHNAVVCGAGIGRMPLGYIAKAATSGELELVLPDWHFRPIRIVATLRRRGPRTKKIGALLEVAMATLQRIEAFANSSPLERYYQEQLALIADTSPAPSNEQKGSFVRTNK